MEVAVFRRIFISTLVCMVAFQLRAEDAATEQIKKKAEACATAMQKGEFEKVAELTHPKVIEILGGKKKAAETMASVMDEMETQGLSIADYTVGSVSEIVTDNDNQFAIVRTTMKMNCPKGILTQNSFLVAISSDKGKSWTFVDGNAVDQLKQINFSVPKALKIPNREEPVLTPKK